MELTSRIVIRDTDGKREGPGNNIFSRRNVKIEGPEGKEEIIIKATKNSCSEIFISEELGFGVYSCDVDIPCLPKGMVLGFFLYKDDENEADIEFSRWNKFFSRNCQFVVQPDVLCRFWNLKRSNQLKIRWEKDHVEFSVNNKKWIHYGSKKKDFGKLHINLWAYGELSECQAKIRNIHYEKT